MRIAIQRMRGESGASNFLNILRDTINKVGLARVRLPINPFHDVGLYSSVAKDYFRKPYVLRLDGIYYDLLEKYGKNEILNFPIYKSIDGATGIIFQSEFSKSLVESHYGNISAISTVILNGIPINPSVNRVDQRKIVKSSKDKIIILCSARWRSFKRLNSTIKAIKKLRKEVNCELHVLGDVGGLSTQFDFVKYIGNVRHSEIINYLQNADIFLHLACFDNCPNSVIEAIGARLPVVCSSLGGTREIVESTRGGIISECDKYIAHSSLVDLQNPPEPDYEILINDILGLLKNYNEIIYNINTEVIDINNVAKKYVEFIIESIKHD